MNERLYFDKTLNSDSKSILLNEEESHHLLKVIRAKAGDEISLMNGKGIIADASITEASKKQALLEIHNIKQYPALINKIHLGICPLKKRDKFELVIEKATELGVSEISIIQSEFSERSKINTERLEKIIISAAKQSINPYSPILNPVIKYADFINSKASSTEQKLIAWCGTTKQSHIAKLYKPKEDCILLIGPEGDFSASEIELSTGRNFVPVNLGSLRYRSETAALFAIAALQTLKEITS